MNGHVRIIRVGLALLVVAVIAAGLYRIVLPFMVPIAWAIVLVLTTWPLYQQLLAAMPRRPGIAALLMTAWVALILTVLVTPLVTALLNELSTAVERINEFLSADDNRARALLLRTPHIGPFLAEHYDAIRREGASALQALSQYRPQIVIFATSAARGLFNWIFQFSMCLVAMHYLYRYGRRLRRGLLSIADQIGGAPFMELFGTVHQTVRASVYATLVTALVQALLAGIGFALFGAPVPVLLGFLTLVVSLIPIGPPLVYLPVALFVGLQENGLPWGAAIALWGVLIVSLSDNVTRPYFLTRRTRLPFFPMLVGIVGGLIQFGFIGVFVGPVIIALAQALIGRYFLDGDEEPA